MKYFICVFSKSVSELYFSGDMDGDPKINMICYMQIVNMTPLF